VTVISTPTRPIPLKTRVGSLLLPASKGAKLYLMQEAYS